MRHSPCAMQTSTNPSTYVVSDFPFLDNWGYCFLDATVPALGTCNPLQIPLLHGLVSDFLYMLVSCVFCARVPTVCRPTNFFTFVLNPNNMPLSRADRDVFIPLHHVTLAITEVYYV